MRKACVKCLFLNPVNEGLPIDIGSKFPKDFVWKACAILETYLKVIGEKIPGGWDALYKNTLESYFLLCHLAFVVIWESMSKLSK